MTCAFCGTGLPLEAIYCGECGRMLRPVALETVDLETVAIPTQTPVVETFVPPAAEIFLPAATADVSSAQPAARQFVLQFSTGERVTVSGTGLIGRNPSPEPGERFDQLVRVLDPSRSVSKLHLEFGQESGQFWIMDRFSANGTVLHEPDAEPVSCPPNKRFRVSRGGRVHIADQFFNVS